MAKYNNCIYKREKTNIYIYIYNTCIFIDVIAYRIQIRFYIVNLLNILFTYISKILFSRILGNFPFNKL